MTVRVDDVMRRHVFQISPASTVAAAAREMLLHDVESLVVVDDDRVVGIVTERDLVAAVLPSVSEFMGDDGLSALSDIVELAAGHSEIRVGEVMTSPVVVTEPDRSLLRALGTMVSRRLRRLPVEDPVTHRLVGILTQRDILAAVFLAGPLAAQRPAEQASANTPQTGAGIAPR